MRSKSNVTIFSSKSVERVAGTTIAEQMGEGVADVVAAFFGEDVENIKVRTYKMRLPGMKTADESGDRIGLSFFSAGWCEVSGRECQIHGLWRGSSATTWALEKPSRLSECVKSPTTTHN